jgi:MOSC domain-containing protein YiiM
LGRVTSSDGLVSAVSRSSSHSFSKPIESSITLLAELGVEGDAHLGVTVKHRSRVARDPSQPNLRQVHLIHHELLDELRAAGIDVGPGQLGENVTTRGLHLLALPTGSKLRLGADAIVEITGLRNPCLQIEEFRTGALDRVVGRDSEGNVVRKAGVMAIVVVGGVVRTGDPIRVELPLPPHVPLAPV